MKSEELDTELNEDTETTQPLQDWANAPTVRELKADLLAAKPSHQTQMTKIAGWLDNLHVRGGAAVPAGTNGSKHVPQLIRKQAEWRYAALSEPFLSTDDMFDISPVSWEDREAAQQNQILLNNQFSTKIRKTRFIDEYVRASVDEGEVVVRVGWDFQQKEVDETRPTWTFVADPESLPLHEELHALMQEDPDKYALEVPEELQTAHEMTMEERVPYMPQQTGEETVKIMKTVRNCPTLDVCDLNNLVIDPTCEGDLDKAKFFIYNFESSPSELKDEGDKYSNLDRINIEANSPLADPDHQHNENSDFKFSDNARKKVVVYEYWGFWDIHGTGSVESFVAAWVGDTMIRLELNPFPDNKLPFVGVQYLPVRKQTYGEPDGALLVDNQKIAGAVTRGMIDIMAKSANGQTGIRKDALDVTNRRKYEKGMDYEFNGNVDARQAIYMHTYPEIPQSAQYMLNLQHNEAESLSGVQAFAQNGISGASLGDTAAAVRGALDAASKREMGILRRLADGMVQIGRKIIAMNAVFLEEEEVVRVTNEKFVPIRRDDLAGNFDMRLAISTAEQDNAQAAELAFLLQTIGPDEDPGMRKMLLSELTRLRKMPDLAKRIQEYQPQPDPIAQERAMLELELLKAEIAEKQAQAMENQAEAMLDQARTLVERARAANLQSLTDKANLDFVEQESGVTQERALQRQGEQARSNMAMKEREHELNLIADEEKELTKYLLGNKAGVTA